MKAVIFDLDVTLLDTLEDIRAAINYARLAFDGEPISPLDTKRYVGNGLKKALIKSILEHGPKLESEDEEELMFQLMMQYYRNHPAVYAKPYCGIINLLNQLKAKGYKIAILSNKADEIVQNIVKICFPKALFDFVQGQIPSLPLKPSPISVENIINRLSLDKNQVLYIGDSEVDYKTAMNAKLKYLIVNYGFRSKEELTESGIMSIDHVPTIEEIDKALE